MIIGLVGFKRVGKSTAAEYLERTYQFQRFNFKDALVKELRENFTTLLPIVADQYGLTIDELFERKPPVIRALMQNYGTEVRRREDEDYWVKQWSSKITHSSMSHFVADDVRFANEAEAILDNGGVLVRLTRPDITGGGDHASETEQLHIVADYTIECTPGDTSTLYKALDEIILKHK